MNYRHSFHAGNFADILKHAVLARILAYLSLKEAPFRVIDTHAGAGIYDLTSSEASRTGEAREGIERLRSTRLDEAAEAVLAPYREILDGLSPEGKTYPGSPAIIQYLLRDHDRASFNELHGETFFALRQALGKDARIKANQLDGYMAWKAQIPPPERRGLVLVDPPFEVTDEFERLIEGAEIMGRKWPTGIGLFWYPIKNQAAVARFEDHLAQTAFPKILIAELHVDAFDEGGPPEPVAQKWKPVLRNDMRQDKESERGVVSTETKRALGACGLAILNPPYTLHDELKTLLPALSKRLARSKTGRWRLDWLKGP